LLEELPTKHKLQTSGYAANGHESCRAKRCVSALHRGICALWPTGSPHAAQLTCLLAMRVPQPLNRTGILLSVTK